MKRNVPRCIWVVIEPFREKIPKWVAPLVRMGQEVAVSMDAGLCLVGFHPDKEREAPLKSGIEQGFQDDFHFLESYSGRSCHRILSSAVTEHRPLAVIAPATPIGREMTARLAASQRCWFIPRCTGLYPEDPENIRASRQVLGGQMEQWVRYPLDRPVIVSVQMEFLGPGEPVRLDGISAIYLQGRPIFPSERPLETFKVAMGSLSLSDAQVVVAAGAGAGDAAGFRLVAQLAEDLGGEVAGSQVAVEKGWVSRSRQIGRSGRSVYPGLFVACGISGSTHFTSGMLNSDVIAAIDIDPDAPIFRIADIRIVGDLRQVIPALIRQIRQRRKR